MHQPDALPPPCALREERRDDWPNKSQVIEFSRPFSHNAFDAEAVQLLLEGFRAANRQGCRGHKRIEMMRCSTLDLVK